MIDLSLNQFKTLRICEVLIADLVRSESLSFVEVRGPNTKYFTTIGRATFNARNSDCLVNLIVAFHHSQSCLSVLHLFQLQFIFDAIVICNDTVLQFVILINSKSDIDSSNVSTLIDFYVGDKREFFGKTVSLLDTHGVVSRRPRHSVTVLDKVQCEANSLVLEIFVAAFLVDHQRAVKAFDMVQSHALSI